jgi:hypothetical protein
MQHDVDGIKQYMYHMRTQQVCMAIAIASTITAACNLYHKADKQHKTLHYTSDVKCAICYMLYAVFANLL